MSNADKTDSSGDPIVDEIRAIRARYWQQAGATGAGYLRLMRELAEQRETTAHATDREKQRKSA